MTSPFGTCLGERDKYSCSLDLLMIRQVRTSGGLLRADVTWEGAVIKEVTISGDFFLEPPDAIENLENALQGKRWSEVPDIISTFLKGAQMPLITLEDLLSVLKPEENATG